LSAIPRDAARRLTDPEIAEVAPLVGLELGDMAGPAYLAGCGLSWVYLEVRADAVPRARPSGRRLAEVDVDLSDLRDPIDGVDVYAVNKSGAYLQIASRVFVPGFGIPEDPATGSAAAGLGLALVATGHAAGEGSTSYRIEQGRAMGRPSALSGRVEATGGTATRVHVAGQVVPVARGQIRAPAG
jgi:trans-2,3-dihydro-3-hydroxyanthranilate isomerase